MANAQKEVECELSTDSWSEHFSRETGDDAVDQLLVAVAMLASCVLGFQSKAGYPGLDPCLGEFAGAKGYWRALDRVRYWLDQLPNELTDDPSIPLLNRWSVRFRKLLIALGRVDTDGRDDAALLTFFVFENRALSNRWRRQLLLLADDLSALYLTKAATRSKGAGQEFAAATHSNDFRSVNWFGTQYTFSRNQAAVVQVLWEHWERGTPEVSADVLHDLDIQQTRFVLIFRRNSAWNAMIVPGYRKGTCRLQPPKSSERTEMIAKAQR